ncbi:MAG: UDP-N-acetylmuramoyl-L-alanine--D-glutamate ligase [Clostridia bacterium]|nr:UDP-N-acetylmuramoyl-L-alanine--D-glutamate ligase [Clostridia bacterium]
MEYRNEKLEEFNKFLNERKVAVIGLGVSNLPLIEYLHNHNANVTVFDNKTIDEIPKDVMDKITQYSMKFSFGEKYLSNLHGFELIFRSPSCLPTTPELVEEEKKGALITTEIELVIKMSPSKIIGITGSEGKTTTTTLVAEVIKNAGYNCFLGGNIGTPLFTRINEMKPDDIVVLELSSFQLMDMEVSPDVSIVTNITPNHLNVHKDYQEYIDAKKNIFKYQNKDGVLIINYDNEITKEFAKEANGKVIYFSSKERLDDGYIVDGDIIKQCEEGLRKHLINTNEITIKGKHNYENICAVLAATQGIVDIDNAIDTITKFKGVHHRLEFVKEKNGIKWYNDSAATSPTRTIAGINGFKENIILIAGGSDKNLDYTPIAKPIVEHVKKLLLIGETSTKIYDAVKKELEVQHKNLDISMCDSLEQTIKLARRSAESGDVVLFSPASASFDMFKNMYDRGDQFKKLVAEEV